MKNKIDIVLKEKEDLSCTFWKTKKDFDLHKSICKGKNPKFVFYQNEFDSLKTRINILDANLKNCAFNMKKLDSMFPKGEKTNGNTLHEHTPSMCARHNTHMLICKTRCTLVHIVATKAI